jgi:hypothetical protein
MRLLADRLQHIAGTRDLRQVDLGLDLRFAVRAAAALFGAGGFLLPGKEFAHTLGFVDLDGTRVGLLFGDADFRQGFKNLSTLDFQLARQIVDSNLHPRCVFPSLVHPIQPTTALMGAPARAPLDLHRNLTVLELSSCSDD